MLSFAGSLHNCVAWVEHRVTTGCIASWLTVHLSMTSPTLTPTLTLTEPSRSLTLTLK